MLCNQPTVTSSHPLYSTSITFMDNARDAFFLVGFCRVCELRAQKKDVQLWTRQKVLGRSCMHLSTKGKRSSFTKRARAIASVNRPDRSASSCPESNPSSIENGRYPWPDARLNFLSLTIKMVAVGASSYFHYYYHVTKGKRLDRRNHFAYIRRPQYAISYTYQITSHWVSFDQLTSHILLQLLNTFLNISFLMSQGSRQHRMGSYSTSSSPLFPSNSNTMNQ